MMNNKKISVFKYLLFSLFTGLFFIFILPVRTYAMTVVLDPGHGGAGGSGSGAIYEPFIEKDLNYAVATQVKKELEEAGIETYLTRSEDMSLSLEDRALFANSVHADLLISIHFNSSGPHDKSGSEVWTSMYTPYFDAGVALGSSILRQLTAFGFDNKGVKTRPGASGDYYGIIRHGTALGIPTIIVEHCFIDSLYDRAILQDTGTEALGHADATGIIEYINATGGTDYSLSDGRDSVDPLIYGNLSEAHSVTDDEDGRYEDYEEKLDDSKESKDGIPSNGALSVAHSVNELNRYSSTGSNIWYNGSANTLSRAHKTRRP